jgi:hypothetical protein
VAIGANVSVSLDESDVVRENFEVMVDLKLVVTAYLVLDALLLPPLCYVVLSYAPENVENLGCAPRAVRARLVPVVVQPLRDCS